MKVSDDYEASIVMLDILCQYIGINSWDDFNKQADTFPQKKSVTKNPASKRLMLYLPVILGFIALLATFYFFLKKPFTSAATASIHLTKTKLSGDFPYSVFVGYEIPASITDSCYIDFTDKEIINYLPKEKTGISHMYDLPGYYPINIISPTDTQRLHAHIKHPKWIGEVHHFATRIDAVKVIDPIENGYFSITPEMALKAGMDTTKLFFTTNVLSKDFDINLDSVEFNIRMQMEDDFPEDFCKWGDFTLFGEHGKIWFTFAPKGCDHWIVLQVSEIYKKGIYDEIKGFTLDNSKAPWNDIKVISKDNTVSVYLDQKEIFSTPYTNKIGSLKTISCRFNRSGKVDFLNFKSLEGKTLLEENFD